MSINITMIFENEFKLFNNTCLLFYYLQRIFQIKLCINIRFSISFYFYLIHFKNSSLFKVISFRTTTKRKTCKSIRKLRNRLQRKISIVVTADEASRFDSISCGIVEKDRTEKFRKEKRRMNKCRKE